MLKYNRDTLDRKLQVKHGKEQFNESITTGVLQIQLTCKRTFWKAYEIIYKTFINIKSMIPKFTRSKSSKHKICSVQTESNQG
jgi:hypothetical protein